MGQWMARVVVLLHMCINRSPEVGRGEAGETSELGAPTAFPLFDGGSSFWLGGNICR